MILLHCQKISFKMTHLNCTIFKYIISNQNLDYFSATIKYQIRDLKDNLKTNITEQT